LLFVANATMALNTCKYLLEFLLSLSLSLSLFAF
jgi:hypothetical protein